MCQIRFFSGNIWEFFCIWHLLSFYIHKYTFFYIAVRTCEIDHFFQNRLFGAWLLMNLKGHKSGNRLQLVGFLSLIKKPEITSMFFLQKKLYHVPMTCILLLNMTNVCFKIQFTDQKCNVSLNLCV